MKRLTLWKANPRSNRYLTTGLFKNLQQGKPLAEALRQSSVDLLRKAQYSNPFYWAPTVVFGDAQ